MPQVLTANLAVVALFIVAWGYLHGRIDRLPRAARDAVFGLLMGSGAVASMLLSVEVERGFLFDLRGSLVVIAGFFGGPLAMIISAGIAAACRVALGGTGLAPGLVGICLAAATGVIGRAILGKRRLTIISVILLSCGTAASTVLGILSLPPTMIERTLVNIGPLTVLLNFATTMMCGSMLLLERRRAEERDLLRGAMRQAPDYFYVKDLESRFVVVNWAVAALHGVSDPRQMRGRSDFDLETEGRADELFAAEQRILVSGEPLVGLSEQLTGKDGKQHWYETSKAPIRNPDGDIIGIAGVTRDVSDSRRLQAELELSRNLMSRAMAEMTDGLALFGADGRLVFCNEQYRTAFPRTAEFRVPGTHIRDIVTAVVERGEQVNIPQDDASGWIDEITASLRAGGVQEIELYDGRWLHVSTTPADDGTTMVMTYDVTDAHRSTMALLSLNDQLKALATEDGLTGLFNRRSFDQALDAELTRTASERMPLSLLMVDVDKFKSYNDRYGHQAGDQCLRAVAQVLKATAHRPGQTVARYGGEEFVAILVGADEDGAYRVAEALRKALRDLQLPHEGSDSGFVTVSVGIACYPAGDGHRYAPELIGRADEALYDAKAAGRDRVTGWRKRHAVRLA
jgi:diguanylate cyclase (GGDEF)-like protein/PAS domain S-box-containing protein